MGRLSLALKFEGKDYEASLQKLMSHPKLEDDGAVRVSYASVNRDTKRAVVTITAQLTEAQERLILKVLGISS